jgi:transcription antitermination factor NusG
MPSNVFSVLESGPIRRGLDIQEASAIDQSAWQVLHVRSNYEKKVAHHLEVRGIEHYLPLYKVRAKWTDRTVVTERALFCGYVFARITPVTRVAAISTPGVVRSLGEEAGSLVSCDELNRIREGLSTGLLLRPHTGVAVGERVRVRSGIFVGVEGIVTEFRQQCKVIITLAAVRQYFSLEVSQEDIEILKKPCLNTTTNFQVAFEYKC